MTGRWVETRQTGDWMRGPDAGGNRPNVGTQCPIEYSKVLERHIYDRTHLVAGDRTLVASDQWFVAAMVGTTRRVRSGRLQRPVSSRKADFVPSGYFLSGAYK